MGVVTKEKSTVPEPFRLEDHNIQDFVFDSDEEVLLVEDGHHHQETTQVHSAPSTPRRRRHEKKADRSALIRFPAFEQGQNARRGRRQGPGARKLRRMEHAKQLASFVDAEDICDDFSDTLPDTITAFTQLFLEKENMEAWNDFIEKSEMEQEAYLKNPTGKRGKKNRTQSESGGHVLGGRGGNKDQRSAHPAFSGEACFRRVDSKLRDLLRHKHLPIGKVENFENDLLEFFLTFSDGVWVNIVENGFDRLLLHAVAQYMSLKSKSYDAGTSGGKRETHVENPKPFFVPPREKLVAYLNRNAEKS